MLRTISPDRGILDAKPGAVRHVAQPRARAALATWGRPRTWRHGRSAPFSQVAAYSRRGAPCAGPPGMLQPLLQPVLPPLLQPN